MLVLRDGFEPSTSRLSIEGSNLLSYRSIYTLVANHSLVLRPLERPGQPQEFLFKGNYIKTSPSVVRGHAEVFRHEVPSTHPAISWQPPDQKPGLSVYYYNERELSLWTDRRDPNPQPPAWQAGALPVELLPDIRERRGALLSPCIYIITQKFFQVKQGSSIQMSLGTLSAHT